jgi:hypothetical protein
MCNLKVTSSKGTIHLNSINWIAISASATLSNLWNSNRRIILHRLHSEGCCIDIEGILNIFHNSDIQFHILQIIDMSKSLDGCRAVEDMGMHPKGVGCCCIGF